MSGPALERVFRAASGRIIGVLAARYRDLTLAEDGFSEACVRAVVDWRESGVPDDPAAWLYCCASRVVLDSLRKQRVREAHANAARRLEPSTDDLLADDRLIIPDERLRLIFICCHPAVARDSRAALTLKLVCGLTTIEIARAFLLPEATLAQRIVRAKHKIAEAGVPFELPSPNQWPGRLEAVLSTLEVTYAKAHEDASGTCRHASFASEVLQLTSLLTELLPQESEVHAMAALVRYAEARRAARVDTDGCMVALADQNPTNWDRKCIEEADSLLAIAKSTGPPSPRLLQAELQRIWCARRDIASTPPWKDILRVYDDLLLQRDDAVVRINRVVALVEVSGPVLALRELEQLDARSLTEFIPYHAVHADLLARIGRFADARHAYERVLALDPGPAEARWIRRKLASLSRSGSEEPQRA